MKILLMADQDVGARITQWLISNYRDDIFLIVTTSKNNISELAEHSQIAHLLFESEAQLLSVIDKKDIDLGFLIWWPKIIKKKLISCTNKGFINTHPSFLPYCRGKHYNFWTLVEESPFGVSLHLVNTGIDDGDIISQSRICYDWEDNGESLYKKAKAEMIDLFIKTYPKLRSLNIYVQKQDLTIGSFHLAAEIDEASRIDLDNNYKVRELLNLLRARTFYNHPACYFKDNGNEYEVRVQITKKK